MTDFAEDRNHERDHRQRQDKAQYHLAQNHRGHRIEANRNDKGRYHRDQAAAQTGILNPTKPCMIT